MWFDELIHVKSAHAGNVDLSEGQLLGFGKVIRGEIGDSEKFVVF
jgi:hypothetical protein